MGGKSETRWFESRELGWGGGVQNQTKTNNGKKTQNIIV